MTCGNVKAQRRRYKKYHKGMIRSPDEVELIDGNWSYYPYAFCTRKGAYLTKGLAATHRCQERKCNRFERVVQTNGYNSN